MFELLAQIRADQRARWVRGERIPIEVYLERHPELTADEESAVDLIYSEYLLCAEFGETPRPEHYLIRFPQYAESLRSQLELHALLEVTLPLEPPSVATMPRLPAVDTEGRQRDQTPPLLGRAGAKPPAEMPIIPGYEVQGWLGMGGRGVVYRARQLSLDRVVALKMLRHAPHAEDGDGFLQMQREARAAAELNDPHIVQVYDFGEHEGQPYFTMEFVAGGSLANRLTAGPLEPEEAVRLTEKLARALDAVHRNGIVHRDLKPGNVLLTTAGEPKVADFGLAKQLDGEASLNPSGAIVGTVGYMAPEQAAGKNREVGPAADVWALGAILYECLTGRPPFPWSNLLDTLHAVRHRDPESPRRLRAGLPRDPETICLKCLEKDPRKRYASALTLAEDCAAFLKKEPIKARQRRWYEKLGREARRHPFVTAAAVFLLSAAVAVPLAVDRLDPERPRREAEAMLAGSKTYELRGDEPMPGPLRWVLGDAGLPRPNAAEKCFSVETVDTGLLEVVADPMTDRFRFSAWVRHDSATGAKYGSLVGLYFGYRQWSNAQGLSRFTYYTLRLADRGPASGMNRDREGHALGTIVLHNQWQMACLGRLPFSGSTPLPGGKWIRRGEPHEVAPWRWLAVTVTPHGVEALWKNPSGDVELVTRVSAAQVKECFVRRQDAHPMMAELLLDYKPRGGLGLYVRSGKAMFRNVVIQPLSAAN